MKSSIAKAFHGKPPYTRTGRQLPITDVLAILTEFSWGKSFAQLSRRWNITQSTVESIVRTAMKATEKG